MQKEKLKKLPFYLVTEQTVALVEPALNLAHDKNRCTYNFLQHLNAIKQKAADLAVLTTIQR